MFSGACPIASTRLRVVRMRLLRIAFLFLSFQGRKIEAPARLITTSCLETSSCQGPLFVGLPAQYAKPILRGPFCDERERMVTEWPSPRSPSVKAAPKNPVPPVINTFMFISFLLKLDL